MVETLIKQRPGIIDITFPLFDSLSSASGFGIDVAMSLFLVLFIPMVAHFVPVFIYHITRSRPVSQRDSAIFKSEFLLPVLKRHLTS